MKYTKSISWFLGLSMFMFGFLKFFNPFKEWYSVQISASGLGEISYAMGIMGELAVGLSFFYALFQKEKISPIHFKFIVLGASLVLVIMMSTGIYVHLHPAVPAHVLPLNIKPPYIPGFFLVLGLMNAFILLRVWKTDDFSNTIGQISPEK